jgi:diguanylate cyclase (GGDEF)-like protein
MKKTNFEILAIGLDSYSIDAIKDSLKQARLEHHISFLNEVSELDTYSKKNAQAVFLFSNKQSQKSIDEIRKIHQEIPRSAIVLMSPRLDHHGIVGAFRAGLFDFMTLPLEKNELRTVIYRLKMYGAIQSGQWTPERAVLHMFSRPESFSSITDVASSLNQYLNLFFEVEKVLEFNESPAVLESLKKKLKLKAHQSKRIRRFLQDETGLIFGLRFVKDRFYFLIKKGGGEIYYLVARNTSNYEIHDILSDYLSNVLRTSLSILSETQKREEIRMLTLTDDVTGLFNQRKLLEDLEFYISRYDQDQQGFSLLFVDIDYFKTVNDRWGHVVGSQLLVDMAAILKGQLRSYDLVYRYGGDEFIVLLPRTTVEETKRIALRVSDAVKQAKFVITETGENYNLSLSVGIASFPSDADSAKSIIDFADKMMYLSKKSGRGKVFHVTEVSA